MNNLKLRRVLKKIAKYDFIIIYGAGGIGKKVANLLINNGIKNFVYAVSDKHQNPEKIDGVDVKEIQELCNIKSKAIVIVATMPNIQNAITDTLNEKGFHNRFYVDDKFLKQMGVIQVNGIFPEKHPAFYESLNNFLRKVLRNLSCKNIIVFESKIDYTENCRALSEYIEENMPEKYKLVWIVKEINSINKRKNITYISRHRMSVLSLLRLNYYISRARFIFFTHPSWLLDWKKEQRVINLGHGNPLKKADNPNAHVADCVLASSEDGIKYRKLEYKEDINVEVLGPPRNDWLFQKNTDVLKAYIGEKAYKKIIVCFPTYKQYDVDLGNIKRVKYDSREENVYCLNTINIVEDLENLNELLKEKEIILICKEHYLQKKNNKANRSNIIYLDNEMLQANGHDLYQLMGNADALITDFSSIYMDFLLLNRPVGFFSNTIGDYERGFAVENPEQYMPGQKILDNQDLRAFIENVATGKDEYADKRKVARDLIFKYQDNQNCRRCVNYFNL